MAMHDVFHRDIQTTHKQGTGRKTQQMPEVEYTKMFGVVVYRSYLRGKYAT